MSREIVFQENEQRADSASQKCKSCSEFCSCAAWLPPPPRCSRRQTWHPPLNVCLSRFPACPSNGTTPCNRQSMRRTEFKNGASDCALSVACCTNPPKCRLSNPRRL